MYFLKNQTVGRKTGFRDPGHENWHKSCLNGTNNVEKEKNKKKPDFGIRDPGQENWHKLCLNGIKPCCEGKKTKNLVTLML